MSEPEANNEAPRPSRIPVVGIGASAGGLEALTVAAPRTRAREHARRDPGARHVVAWTALEEAAAGRHELDSMLVERAFGREGRPPMRFSARCIPAEQDRPALTLVMMKEGG